jgi:hypothetical protein
MTITQTQNLQRLIEQIQQPGIHFIGIEHDNYCPAAESQHISDCICKPDVKINTEQQAIANMVHSRVKRRAAKRAAEKAMHKAMGGGHVNK